MIEVEDDRNPPVLTSQPLSLQLTPDDDRRTGGIEKTERVWVVSNHDSNGIYQSTSTPELLWVTTYSCQRQ